MIKAELKGVNVVIGGIRGLSVRAKAAAFQGVVKGLAIARDASVKMISAQDHSLAELAAMGHPYATRHPFPPHSEPIVHVQTGEYLSALKVNSPVGTQTDIVEGSVNLDGDGKVKELDRWIQEGTLKMIARPWMAYVIEQFGDQISAVVKAEIMAGIAASKSA